MDGQKEALQKEQNKHIMQCKITCHMLKKKKKSLNSPSHLPWTLFSMSILYVRSQLLLAVVPQLTP